MNSAQDGAYPQNTANHQLLSVVLRCKCNLVQFTATDGTTVAELSHAIFFPRLSARPPHIVLLLMQATRTRMPRWPAGVQEFRIGSDLATLLCFAKLNALKVLTATLSGHLRNYANGISLQPRHSANWPPQERSPNPRARTPAPRAPGATGSGVLREEHAQHYKL
ncbi:hypothetical protein PsYK624_137760 [Phanerochaete sordida]|uniref:Uncharacterized protein n=1 Tax=Phanerochaete sordida TaxID=48140 RepID=A0A9P3LJN5_9APHY|nr:hypothetical protein PsYK624_137760 [Phanerochaete sordida]